MELDMLIGAAVAGVLIVSLFLEMVATGAPKPVEHADRRAPHAK